MEISYSYVLNCAVEGTSLNGTSIRYGKQEGIQGLIDLIVECEDTVQRHALVDALVQKMEANSEQNGFLCRDDDVKISFNLSKDDCGVRLADMGLYYEFFDRYSKYSKYKDENGNGLNAGAAAFQSVTKTITNYFGEFNGDDKKRLRLTNVVVEDTIEYPSVAVLKRQNCAQCAERASVAHNLWLLLGRELYYVSSLSSKFEDSNDNAHAFCLVRHYSGGFVLYDQARNNVGLLEGNPIETILAGKPLVIDGEQFKNGGVYANACCMEQEQCK